MTTFSKMMTALFLVTNFAASSAFVVPPPAQRLQQSDTSLNGIFDKVGEFFEELDAFVDDATSRRLGAGSAFYGKRKSNFYGENDKGRKKNRGVPDPTEDYQGPTSTGLFTWQPDENGQLRPVTRLREKNVERNPNYWDRVYEKQAKKNS